MTTIKSFKNSQNTIFVAVLVIVLILATYLRLDGISWDSGFSYSPHPDERAILMKVSEIDFPNDDIPSLIEKDASSWNPRWFAYGTFPIYLLNTVQALLEPITPGKALDPRILGRILSALADIGTVCGVAMLGRRFFSSSIGLLASLFTAFAVLHIQLAHFFTFDTFVAFFSIWTLFFLYKVAKSGDKTASMVSGLLIGLGIASKFSVFVLILPFVAAHLIFVLREINNTSSNKALLWETIYSGLIGISSGIVAVAIAQPYALLDWTTYWSDINEQSEMVRRLRDYPYTRQYIDTAAYIYQVVQMGRWGLGWPLTILSILSIFWALGRGQKLFGIIVTTSVTVVIPAAILLHSNDYLSLSIASGISVIGLISSRILSIEKYTNSTLLLSWIVPYLLITGSFEVKFIRYLLPVLPVLFVMCAALLTHQISKNNRFKSMVWVTILIIAVITTVIYGLSTRGIYSSTHTAVSSANWINEVEPNGVKILKEHWEESLPNLNKHSISELPIYDPDGPVKIKHMSESLENADYLVIYSNRMYGTVTRLPERYPLMTSYYHSLFSGNLGYELVNVEASYLSIFGIDFIEDTFDRPGIVNPIPDATSLNAQQGVNVGFADESFSVYDHPKVFLFKNKAKLTSETIQQTIYKNSENKKTPGIESTEKLIRGNLMMSNDLREKQQLGGTWSEIIGTDSLGAKYPTFTWLLILELLSLIVLPFVFLLFNAFTFKGYLFSKIIGILLVCFLTWCASSLGVQEFNKTTIWIAITITASINAGLFLQNRQKLTRIIKTHWKSFVTLELLFLLLFALFLLIRAMNPDLWHPYRGGEKPMDIAYLNAVLKSTYMPPYDPWFAGGYLNYYYWGQFIVASLIHLSGVTTEIAYNLAVATFFALTGSAAISIGINLASNKIRTEQWLKILAGGSCVLFILILGNMNAFYQIFNLIGNFVSQGIWGEFDFWQSSRMMPPDPPGFEITEFPFFTFLFADLHAHLMAIPFGLLAIGTSMALIAGVGKTNNRLRHWSQLWLLGMILGALRAINTWDVPVYATIAMASILIFHHRSNGGLNILVFRDTVTKISFVALVAIVAFLPYHLSSETFFNSFELTTNLTTFSQMFSINGFFVFVNLSGLLILAKPDLKISLMRLKKLDMGQILKRKFNLLEILCYLIIIVASIGILNLVLTNKLGGAIPTGLIGLSIGSIALYKSFKYATSSFNYQTFSIVISLIAFSILIAVDIWRVEGDIDRMNTVFKFYLQVWVLFAVSSTFMVVHMTKNWIEHGVKTIGLAWIFTFTALLAISLIYPIFGTHDRIRDRFDSFDNQLTLDGYAFAEGTVYRDPTGNISIESDMIAIDWIKANIEGSPVILEGWAPSYRWGSRISVHTGLPTVIGWKWHQEQQRWGFRQEVGIRISDVNSIFTSDNHKITKQLIEKYDVQYILVGNLEKLYYPSSGLIKFETGMDGLIEPIYKSDEVTIYRVN